MKREDFLTIKDHEERIEALISAMTTTEKVSLLAGSSMWTTAPVERLGIPAIKVTDGPNGARGGGGFVGGPVTSACVPVGIALAATWNTDLMGQIGTVLGAEARTKGAQMLLGPTVNMHRSPLNGRNFECYSEDPCLSAKMAVAFIKGLQSQNVGAVIKHYVANDSEFERQTISSEVDERTLREIYLPPFEAAVREAKTWGVMSAYNKVNGTFASENRYILIDILRNEWGFNGLVMSDWFGTKSTIESVNSGLDLEMPGPPIWRGEKLMQALEDGEVDESVLDRCSRNILRIIMRSGQFDNPADMQEMSKNLPEHQEVIRRTAAESIVLLKNDYAILPLDADKPGRIAIIGPNAKTARIMGGGSAQVNAHYAVTPYEGIQAKVSNDTELAYAMGCTNYRLLPPMEAADIRGGSFRLQYYNNKTLEGEPVYESATKVVDLMWLGEYPEGVMPQEFSLRLFGEFTPDVSDDHLFSLISTGKSRLIIDGVVLIDKWTQQRKVKDFFKLRDTEEIKSVPLKAGQTYKLIVEYSCDEDSMISVVRLGHGLPVSSDSVEQAAAVAAEADVALVFVGANSDWEGEGNDRPDMEMVGDQAALIEAVASANPNTVVVLQTGSPVVMPWLDRVKAVIQAWFPGQECGNAIADVLFGDVNPSGKLPQTFPQRLEDNPAFINYPGENGKVRYGEGIFIGYRYYEKKKIKPLFPFGYGLSYTTFSYNNLRLSMTENTTEDELKVFVDVTNIGDREGQEIVQVYIHDVESTLIRPDKELKGFAKVKLDPGETKTVTVTLGKNALAYWDDVKRDWVSEAGMFEVRVGRSSQDIRLTRSFLLK